MSAFDDFYVQNESRVMGACRAKLPPDAVEDAAQDIWLKVLQHPEEMTVPYLKRIISSVIADHYRDSQRHCRDTRLTQSLEGTTSVFTSSRNTEREVETHLDLEAVWFVLGNIQPDRAALFINHVLAEYGEREHHETSTERVRVWQIRQKVRAACA